MQVSQLEPHTSLSIQFELRHQRVLLPIYNLLEAKNNHHCMVFPPALKRISTFQQIRNIFQRIFLHNLLYHSSKL